MKHLLIIVLFLNSICFAYAQTVIPSTITGLTLWLSADSVDTINGKINTWYDKSGNNNSAIQAIVAKQPQLLLNNAKLNNLPVVKFDGVDDFLQFSDINNIKTSFFVFNHSPAYRTSDNLIGHTTNASGSLLSGGLYRLIYYSANWLNIAFINGVSVSPYDLTQDSLYNILTIMPSPDGVANTISHNGADGYMPWTGNVAEVLFYNKVLTSAERISVENYLNNKYAPPVDLGPDLTLTYGFCTNINAGNRFKSFLWSTGETTQTIHINQPGTYWVQAMNVFGYISTDTINVIFPNTSLNITNSTICNGDSILLKTQLTDISNYTFLWSSGETSSQIYAKNPASYFVLVSDTSCGSISSNTISINTDNFASLVSLGNDTSICSGNTISIISPSNYPTPLTFKWQDNSTDSLFIVNSNGTYFVTVTNNRGCSATDNITVNITGVAPQTDFITDTVCFGNTTHFTNLTPGLFDSLLWDFGDGFISNLLNPNHTFNSSGVHNVTLTAYQGLCNKNVNKNVIVKSVPDANFTTQETCTSFPYNFIDNSTANLPDSIITWSWNFGDTSFSNDTNPTHSYPISGNYTVLLTILSSNGCADNISHTINIVDNAPLPVVSNLLTPQNNSIVGIGSITFSWNNFLNASKYRLLISTNPNFTDTIVNYISFSNSIIVNSSLFSTDHLYWKVIAYNICNANIGSNGFNFSVFNQSTISGLTLWLSADSVDTINGKINTWYDKSGNNNSAVQAIVAKQPQLLLNNTKLNNLPVVKFDGVDDFLQFTDINNIKTSFFVFNHSPIYRSSDNLIGHTTNASGSLLSGGLYRLIYYSANWLNIAFVNSVSVSPYDLIQDSLYSILTMMPSPDGVANTISHNGADGYMPWTGNIAEVLLYNKVLTSAERISVENYLNNKYAPPVDLGPDLTLSYGFCTNINAGNRFTKFQWFKNGILLPNDTLESIVTNNSGQYKVIVTNVFGFTSTDSINVIYPNLSLSDSTICYGDTLNYTVNHGGINSILWSNGNTGNVFQTHDGGEFTVIMLDNMGCSFNDTFNVYIDSLSLKLTLGNDTSLCSGNSISPSGGNNITNYLWNDNSTYASLQINSPGDYWVTVTNINGCVAKDTIHVDIHGIAPVPGFSFTNTCLGDQTVFTDNSFTIDGSTINAWQWIINNDTTITQNTSHIFNAIGTQQSQLTVSTTSNCSNTISNLVYINPNPLAQFAIAGTCKGGTSYFTNQSTISQGSLSGMNWDFGDNDTSIISNPQHTFSAVGYYTVQLIATSNEGCKDTIIKNIEIKSSPITGFDFSPACSGSATWFFDLTQTLPVFPIILWKWDFGDGGSSLQQNPQHVYSTVGQYPVSLIIQSLNGCLDTMINYVSVSAPPVAGFIGDSTCLGIPLFFIDTSSAINGSIYKWHWDFGNGTSSNLQNTFAHYYGTGNYTVKLTATSTVDCIDTVSKVVKVYALPVAWFLCLPDLGAPPLVVNFTNNTSGVLSYWNFGDGQISQLTSPVHVFNDTGNYIVWLKIENTHGCLDSTFKSVKVVPNITNLAILNVDYTINSAYITISTTIANIGTMPIINPLLTLSTDKNTPVMEIYPDTLFSGEIVTYSFASQLPYNEANAPTYICVKGSLANGKIDSDLSNNEACKTNSSGKIILNLYPNPANNEITLDLNIVIPGNFKLDIFDKVGRLVYSNQIELKPGFNRLRIDVKSFSKGKYTLRLNAKEGENSAEFIKY